MIEIQCTSCHTRYRIDERVLPDDTPTFKCSRCGHVFNADPVPAKVRKPAAAPPEVDSESQPARTIRASRPRPSALKSQVESDIVKREPVPEPQPAMPEPEVGVPRSNAQLRAPEDRMHAAPVKRPTEEPEVRPAKDRERTSTIRSIAPSAIASPRKPTPEKISNSISAMSAMKSPTRRRSASSNGTSRATADGKWARCRLSSKRGQFARRRP